MNAMRRLALAGILVGTSLVLGISSRAWCQATGLLTSYYDVATSTLPSASGYGGHGASGGAGDGLVRIILPGSGNEPGVHCAMIYVFDDIEEMQACCGCPVTSDGLRTMSVINNVTKNFGVNRGNLNAGVIDIATADPNLVAPDQIPLPPQIGPIGNIAGAFYACDPTGQFGPTVGALSGDFDAKELQQEATEGAAMVAYITHTEANAPVPAASRTLVRGVSVDEFQNARVDDPHLTQLKNFCLFLIQNGSGTGACSCGSGDDNSKLPPPRV